MENKENIQVGTEATLTVGSDNYPYIVEEVRRKGTQVVLRAMSFKPAEGSNFYDNQKWTIEYNPNGKLITANWSRKFKCYLHGRKMPVTFGLARAYQDPSF